MIQYLDAVLRQMLVDEIPALALPDQIGFAPPDQDWRTLVHQGTDVLVNVYLVDLRDNRRLRSNGTVRTVVNQQVYDEPAPRRMDCHYLISAWSPAAAAMDPVLDEHAMLGAVAAAFADRDHLVPSEVFAPGPLPAGFPTEIAGWELPVTLMPVEGFLKLAEFWGTMGDGYRWKPVIHVVVTLPLVMAPQPSGPVVTTMFTDVRRTGDLSGEATFDIGGHVLDTLHPQPDGSPTPLAGAWIQLLTLAGVRRGVVRSDDAGQFVFTGLPGGSWRLRASTSDPALGVRQRDVTVPSPSGEYDLLF